MKKNNFKIVYTLTLLAGLILTTITPEAISAEFAVVVNAKNGTSGSQEEIRREVKRTFMKQQSSWTGNIDAFPLDRDPSNAAHQAFLKNVLQMSEQELDAHWLSMKQQQGQTPPRVVGSTRILLRLIGKKEGGMGVVNVDELAGAPASVKALLQFTD